MQRLNQVQAGTDIFTYTYQDIVAPLVQRLTRPNSSMTNYQYDGMSRITKIENKTSTEEVIASNAFVYNDQDIKGGESIFTNDLMDGFQQGMTTYQYNAVNQLLSSNNPDQAFSYDADGNMSTGYTPEGYAYYALYDGENRLTSIQYTDGDGVVRKTEFGYDGNSFVALIRKYENDTLTGETRIIRDGVLALQERDGKNNILREYAWGLNKGGGIGGLLCMRQNNQQYYYLYDGKGNVRAVIDDDQSVVAPYRYDTFGRLMEKSGSLYQPFQFSTKRYFAEVGLNYFGYRFYASSICRWTSRDPIGEKGGINLYAFVANNSVNLIDPFGLISCGAAKTLCWAAGYFVCFIASFVGGLFGAAVGGFLGGIPGAYIGGLIGTFFFGLVCEYIAFRYCDDFSRNPCVCPTD